MAGCKKASSHLGFHLLQFGHILKINNSSYDLIVDKYGNFVTYHLLVVDSEQLGQILLAGIENIMKLKIRPDFLNLTTGCQRSIVSGSLFLQQG